MADRLREAGSTTRPYYVYDGAQVVYESDLTDAGEAVNTFGAAGLVSRHGQSCAGCAGSIFYLFEPQGSVAQMTDERGHAVSSQGYDAHGSALSGSPTPFGYGAQWGYRTDEETALQLLTHRYYDPQAGRFLTRDPISYAGGVNLYAYAKNMPVNRVDPSGLDDADYPPAIGSGPDQNPWYWSHNEWADNELGQTSHNYSPKSGLPENNPLLFIISSQEAWQAQYRYFGRDWQYADPYGGAYQHCVAACLLSRRTMLFGGMAVGLWDWLSEDSGDSNSEGDMAGEQFGLQCAGKDDLCELECLKGYPTSYPAH